MKKISKRLKFNLQYHSSEVDPIKELESNDGRIKKNLSFTVDKDAGLNDRRIIRFIASTETEDRDRDIIVADGWKFDTYLTNPIVLYMHNRMLPAVAKCVNIFVDRMNKQLIMDVKFPTLEEMSSDMANIHEHAKFSDMLFNMYKNGLLSTVSVGFMGIKYFRRTDQQDLPEYARGIKFEEQELLELSLVTLPANPEAQMVRAAMDKGLFDESEYKSAVDYAMAFIGNKSTTKGSLKDNGVVMYDPSNIVESDWSSANVSASVTPLEWAKLSLIWDNAKTEDELTKADGKFPHHEANGDINKNALIAMKAALLGARGGARPFNGQSDEMFLDQIKLAIEQHANPHLLAAELEEIDIADVKSIKFSKYMELFKDHYTSDQIHDAYNAKSVDDAYKAITVAKLFDIFGNPSAQDIEQAIDRLLVDDEGEWTGYVSQLYPISYPNGHVLVRHFEESDEFMLHSYTYTADEDGTYTATIMPGVPVQISVSMKAMAEEKAGARISRNSMKMIDEAIEGMKKATDALVALKGYDEEEEEEKALEFVAGRDDVVFLI